MPEDDVTVLRREAWAGFTTALATAISQIDHKHPPKDRRSEWLVSQIHDRLEGLIEIEEWLTVDDEENMRKLYRSFLLAYQKVQESLS